MLPEKDLVDNYEMWEASLDGLMQQALMNSGDFFRLDCNNQLEERGKKWSTRSPAKARVFQATAAVTTCSGGDGCLCPHTLEML